jgi:hypothetical protein
MGQLFPIKLPPGMFRNGTEYETAGRWYDGNLVRWENGRLKPIGGWKNVIPGFTFVGIARGGLAFTDDLNASHIIIGTHSNLYAGQRGGSFTDITPPGFTAGRIDSILGNGYGAGPYNNYVPPDGHNTYGTPRTQNTLQLAAAMWQMDTFGNTAVMVSNADRKLYQYNTTGPNAGKAIQPLGAPLCTGVFTTNEDFLLVIGANGVGRLIAWPDVGTSTDWTPTDINSAGSINLNTNGIGLAGARVGLQNLVWTTTDVHLVNYVGQPAIYAPIRIGTACGLIGPRAWAVAASGAGAGEAAYWMSQGGFFQFNGAVTPLPCEVQDYLWQNINFSQATKIYASPNSRFNEIIWFFPSLNSFEIDSYVIYNYKDNIWYFGLNSLLARTTYIDRGPIPLPMAVDFTSHFYEHESGYLSDVNTRVPHVFAQSGPVEIGGGDQIVYANMMLVDGDGLTDAGTYVLVMTPKTKLAPQGPAVTSIAIPFTPNDEGYTPVRFYGRQIGLRFDAVQDVGWELGKLRLQVVGAGRR